MIKVERPGVGDFARGYDTTVKGLASHFVWLNRSNDISYNPLSVREKRGLRSLQEPGLDHNM